MDRRKFLKAGWCDWHLDRSRLVRSTHSWRRNGAALCEGQSRFAIYRSHFAVRLLLLLADVHHGPFVPMAYIRHVVSMTNALKPDIVAFSVIIVHRDDTYIAPAIDELGKLKGKLGRFAVRGNHDNQDYYGRRSFRSHSQAALAEAKIPDLNNTGVWIERGGARLRICGVGDLWTDHQDLQAALGDANERDAVLLLSHNPDYVETIRDPRVSLVLSGHTHGGQIVLPGYGAPIVPSRYGQKYLHGLVEGPSCPVFVTRGVGTVTPACAIFVSSRGCFTHLGLEPGLAKRPVHVT